MENDEMCLFSSPTFKQDGYSCRRWPLSYFAESNVRPHLAVKKNYDCVFKREGQVEKHCYVGGIQMDRINKDYHNVRKLLFLKRVFGFYPSGSRLKPACVKLLILICLFCICATSVTCESTSNYRCVYSNFVIGDTNTITSIDCSSFNIRNCSMEYKENTAGAYTNLTINSKILLDEMLKSVLLDKFDFGKEKQTIADQDVQVDETKLYNNNTLPFHVDVVKFSYNNLTQIPSDVFNLFTGIVSLDLSDNQIQWLDNDSFVDVQNVTSLNLSYNIIDDIANDTFHDLHNLRVLDLSYNKLQLSVINELSMLLSLQYLYLNNNQIQILTNFTFGILPCLIHLDLSNNPLTIIPSRTFIHLQSLQTINMINGSIQEVGEHFLEGLHNLEDLTLDKNILSSISKPVFQNTSLIRLSIACMPYLMNISYDAFQGLSSLINLNISNNPQISFLHPNLFTPLVDLKILDASSSGLNQLSQITFHKNINLTEVYLTNNPFICSCTNAWLASEALYNKTKFVNALALHCMSDGKKIVISNASFDCDEIYLHNVSSKYIAKLGSQLLFKCQLPAKNPSLVMWTTPSGKIFYQHDFHPDASQHLLTPEDIIDLTSEFHTGHYWHYTSSYYSDLSSKDRVIILSDGSLYIDYMLRSDAGPYKCHVTNAHYNQTVKFNLLVDCALSGDVKIFGYIVGLICAFTFFTLNVIYVIISWTARRLVNKRRREIIRQILENMNAYKSTQITRIHENCTHQIKRVRTQYHNQCSRLHRNYNCQVARMKRGCTNQVERVRENYNSKLAHLRDYSSNQIMQIRERANNQIVRIRDYGVSQFEKLRETYKFQQQHVLKLLDTMNLENCRNIVETECMRAESMMYDIDLLGDDDRTDSPTSPGDSEYSTAASSPSSSLSDNDNAGLRLDMSQKSRGLSLSPASSDNSGTIVEVQATIDLEADPHADSWKFGAAHFNDDYLMNISSLEDPSLLQIQDNATLFTISGRAHKPGIRLPTLELTEKHPITKAHKPGIRLPTLQLAEEHPRTKAHKPGIQLPTLELEQDHRRTKTSLRGSSAQVRQDSKCLYMTPETSPAKVFPAFDPSAKSPKSKDIDSDIEFVDSSSHESIV